MNISRPMPLPALHLRTLTAALVALALGLHAGSARAQAGDTSATRRAPQVQPFKLPLPDQNADMAPIASRLAKLQKAGAECGQCAKADGTVACTGALKAFEEADAYTKHLSDLYNEHEASMDDLLRHIAEYKDMTDKFTARDQDLKNAYNISKILTDSAKLTLDLLSLRDTRNGLNDAMAKLKVGWTLNETDAVINKVLLPDTVFESVSGGVSAIDDLLGSRMFGADPHSLGVPERMAKWQTLKGGLSDLAGAIASARELQRKAAAFGDPWSKTAAASGATKGVLNALAKVLSPIAEKEQAKLKAEIEDNIAPGLAHDEAFRDLMGQYNKLVMRMAAIAKARNAAHDALSAAISCSGKCAGARQPSTIGDKSDYGKGDLRDFGDGLKSPYTYGSAMRKTNMTLAGIGKAPANLDNMCKEKKDEIKAAAPAVATPAADKDKKPCERGTGMTGAVLNIACQDSR